MNTMANTAPLTASDSPLAWARRSCDTIMARYAPSELPPAGRWHYHQGVFLQGMEKLWRATGESAYYNYIKHYVDLYIPEDGRIQVKDHLDDIMPGQLLLMLHAASGDAKYHRGAAFLRGLLDTWKTTLDGGFWHKDIYPNQMWLDGIYMEGPFAVKYARQYDEPALYDVVVKQALLMYSRMKDEQTGLLYHAWDASGQAPWANPVTGCSPEFWGRSVGWYGFALCEIIEYLPADHPERAALIRIVGELADSIRRFQDPATGLWYQVVDKGERPDNWLELSCSTLFVFTLSRAAREGYADRSLLESARRGYEGVLTRVSFDAAGGIVVPDICIGTGVGDYAHYAARERKTNDLHGMATFVHMCMELAEPR
ncbi:Unsaturated rhamnogalacturonyl hydrolase YteR [Paenibacillus solanacearum]|uniref:Unsaturated rhamnogalacturonyl hydrolase YteR n=2 Tax=Paenibacillus solanacearum TaxID=2048548 RepID=A0A916K4T4_9BACL|nr:Unsaturated rhamnogalacturonyl hydrolase YteR [Paenibacillus solanacearum]